VSLDGAPDVAGVAPGVWAVSLPLPTHARRVVHTYVFEAPDGVWLVDPGWNWDRGYRLLEAGLRTAGFAMTDVRAVLVTHVHRDHHGLADRVRAASGAWIGLHSLDQDLLRRRTSADAGRLAVIEASLYDAGAPPDELAALRDSGPSSGWEYAPADRLLTDREQLRVGPRTLVALWTPGHTPGHLSFHVPELRLLLTGDHVLPRITPNISWDPAVGGNPLGAYLDSLRRLETLPVEHVLPAHEHRFDDLAGRLAELRAHHEHRFAEILGLVDGGKHTAWGIAAGMTWSTPWAVFDSRLRRAALRECEAHLHALAARGVLAPAGRRPVRWCRAAANPR
jgi:glyoxylase-like metal-dependent hydrolase (beta-lactamase superfamily II)